MPPHDEYYFEPLVEQPPATGSVFHKNQAVNSKPLTVSCPLYVHNLVSAEASVTGGGLALHCCTD